MGEEELAVTETHLFKGEQQKEVCSNLDDTKIITEEPRVFDLGETETPSQSNSLAVLIEKEYKTDGTLVKIEDPPKGEQSDDSKKPALNLGSFKEESNKIGDLTELQRQALYELKHRVQETINASGFEPGDNPEPSIWGIPLLKDDRSDVVLLKFLRAREFRIEEALEMIKNTVQWRVREGIDQIASEELSDDWEQVVFMHGVDRNNHPVCYNVYGEFQNKELYQKAFSSEEKRLSFLKWRIHALEKSITKLDFTPGGISTIFQINDLKNSPGPGKRELHLVTRRALLLLQDNYPEFVAKQVFINVPWWQFAFYAMLSKFISPRTKSKFVFASPAKTPETLFKYIAPEHVPVRYGGLSVDSCDCDSEFTSNDEATEITLKPATKQTVEIIVYERCEIVWELRVVGWEVTYCAEFVPENKEGYPFILQRPIKKMPNDRPIERSSFKVSEVGKIWLIVDNPSSKKKKLLYRFKVKPFPS